MNKRNIKYAIRHIHDRQRDPSRFILRMKINNA